MAVIRLGAVAYLNARPLVHGLDRRPDLFALRFDPPSQCAALLHEGAIDVGMIPSIEFQRGVAPYLIVGGMGIVSDGPVASVALFSSKTIGEIRSIAVDTSSRTSTALLRVLCRESFGIEPEFVPMPPTIEPMLDRCDAALVIGDPALYLDHQAATLNKTDLGQEWKSLTGLPFVWAFWSGRPGVLPAAALAALHEARDAGVAASDEIADAYCGPERAALCRAYLRDNIRYVLDESAAAGLRKYYELAAKHGVIEQVRPAVFYGASA
jgi:chorismate dehydratase